MLGMQNFDSISTAYQAAMMKKGDTANAADFLPLLLQSQVPFQLLSLLMQCQSFQVQ